MTPPLIVGGGPAGSAAAIRLAQQGVRATLIERQRETGDALCGGFLSWETLTALRDLGVDALQGHPVRTLRLFAGGRVAEASLPRPALGLSRHRLDTAMLARAEALGAGIERGVAARQWSDGALVTTDGAILRPEALFLAAGKHDLRGLGRPRETGEQTLGIRVRLDPNPDLDRMAGDAIELHLFDRGYCGIVLQEGGRGNLCLAVRKSRLAEADGDPDALLADWAGESPALADRLAFRGAGSDAIGAVPYGWIARDTGSGVFRLGDQAAVIPSLAGEGIGIAIASGVMAADSYCRGADSSDFQAGLARAAARPVAIAGAIWRAAERPGSARFGVELTRLFPRLAAQIARWTRIPH